MSMMSIEAVLPAIGGMGIFATARSVVFAAIGGSGVGAGVPALGAGAVTGPSVGHGDGVGAGVADAATVVAVGVEAAGAFAAHETITSDAARRLTPRTRESVGHARRATGCRFARLSAPDDGSPGRPGSSCRPPSRRCLGRPAAGCRARGPRGRRACPGRCFPFGPPRTTRTPD